MEGGPRGSNLACAALSVLVRTAWESLGALPGLLVEGRAASEGGMDLVVGPPDDSNRDLVRGITIFLMKGLEGLARDAPGGLEIQTKRIRRDSHGGQEGQRS